jgi:hypothetical protein
MAGLLVVRLSYAQARARAVVFVAPSSAELDKELRDALSAQLSGGSAELVFDRFTADAAPLRRQMQEAAALARTHRAAGVFWLDTQPSGEWLLYLADPGGDRMLVRRIDVEPGAIAAGVEAVGVITRQSSDALLSGGTIGMQTVPTPAVPSPPTKAIQPPAPSGPPPDRAKNRPPPPFFTGLSFSVAYAGDLPAKEIGWQSGLALSVAYRFPPGLYLDAGYTLLRAVDIASDPIVLRLTRSPIHIEGGFGFGHGRLVPGVGGRGTVELIDRHAFSTSGALTGTPDSTRAVVLLSPRVRLDYAFSLTLSAYLSGGVDFALNSFSFVSRVAGLNRVLLEPHEVRPSIELGLSFWP